MSDANAHRRQRTNAGRAAASGIVRALIPIVAIGLAAAPSAMAQSRGELLYTTHCVSCHTTQMHWRDKRSAKDWSSLKFQVRRWQDAVSLGWSDSDIQEVARYLNESIYRFEQGDASRSSLRVPTGLSRELDG